MSQDKAALSPVRMQFRLAATDLCGQTKSVKQAPKNFKSFAQVEGSVKRQGVSHNSGGLKPRKARTIHLGIRLDEHERSYLAEQANKLHLSVSQYARATLLKDGYKPIIDPAKRQLLIELQRELNKQGNNLNQIAKHLNAGIINPIQGEDLLSVLARSLVDTHFSVRLALTEGQTAE